ncbi:MAG: hypothetical protein JO036_19600 [Candidatus Eremiobacteraeota bacterium]|nr:hypothetical protein [Candidatus Eremiobacteraeota bacterium]
MQRTRFAAALAGTAALFAVVGAVGVSAQTTMAPTPASPVGPTSAPSTTATYAPMSTSLPATKPGPAMPPTVGLALDARALRARRTPTGYTLTGQALVRDACTAARFDRVLGTIFPPQFNLDQFRRPGTLGLLCIQRLTWVTAAPKSVVSAAPPHWVTVRTQKGFLRVPVR